MKPARLAGPTRASDSGGGDGEARDGDAKRAGVTLGEQARR